MERVIGGLVVGSVSLFGNFLGYMVSSLFIFLLAQKNEPKKGHPTYGLILMPDGLSVAPRKRGSCLYLRSDRHPADLHSTPTIHKGPSEGTLVVALTLQFLMNILWWILRSKR